MSQFWEEKKKQLYTVKPVGYSEQQPPVNDDQPGPQLFKINSNYLGENSE